MLTWTSPTTVRHSPAVTISPTAEYPAVTPERDADAALTTALQQQRPPPHTPTDRPLPPRPPVPAAERTSPLGPPPTPQPLGSVLPSLPAEPRVALPAHPRVAAAEQRTAAAAPSLRPQPQPCRPPPSPFLNRITLFLYVSADRKLPLCLGLKLHERRLKFCKELRKKMGGEGEGESTPFCQEFGAHGCCLLEAG